MVLIVKVNPKVLRLYKSFKRFICFSTVLLSSLCYSQYRSNDDELRDYFSSILYLTEASSRTEKINGKLYEVVYKDPWTGELLEIKNPSIGSGFFISRGIDIYLVTAEHVARMLSRTSEIKFKGLDGQKREFKISNLRKDKGFPEKLNWIRHPNVILPKS